MFGKLGQLGRLGTLGHIVRNVKISPPAPPAPSGIWGQFEAINAVLTVDTRSNDTDQPYSVAEVSQSGAGAGRLYLVHKVTHTTTFATDTPIACIQVVSPDGSSVIEQYWFNGDCDWQTMINATYIGAVGDGLNITPAVAATYPYSGVPYGSLKDKFTLATSTNSNQTGAVDGIAEPSAPLPVGAYQVPQLLGTYYMYRETSGSILGSSVICRSPERVWSPGERIRIAYIVGNYDSGYDADDVLFVGIA